MFIHCIMLLAPNLGALFAAAMFIFPERLGRLIGSMEKTRDRITPHNFGYQTGRVSSHI